MKSIVSYHKNTLQSLILRMEFVAPIVITMGLAFGSLLSVATLAYFLLVKPLPYEQQDLLFKVEQMYYADNDEHKSTSFNYPSLLKLYNEQEVFDDLAMVIYDKDILTSHRSQPTLSLQFVTPEWFRIADVEMAVGRTLGASEGLSLASPVAVISYEAWETWFNLDTDILNQKLDINGVSFSIVGVTSKNYYEPELNKAVTKTDVWLPWDFNRASGFIGCWGCFNPHMAMIGKLKAELNETQAEQLLVPLIDSTWKNNVVQHSVFDNWSTRVQLTPFNHAIMGDSQKSINLLLFAVIGLVLIASANMTNLFISRLAEQQQKLAIRAAVGADRKDIFKLMFSESGQLMFMAMTLGVLLTGVGFEVIRTYMDGILPRIEEVSFSSVTIVIAFTVWLVFSLLFASICQRMINYKNLSLSLQSSGKGTGVQVSDKLRKSLIVAQVTIVTTLIAVSVSLFQSAISEINKPLGFNTENIIYLDIANFASSEEEFNKSRYDFEEIKSKVLAMPEVQQVSRSSSPLSYFEVWSLTEEVSNEIVQAKVKKVNYDYFDFIEQEVVFGRSFTEADFKDQSNAIVVNEKFLDELSYTGDAIGLRLKSAGGTEFEIVGVVRTISMPGSSIVEPRVYPIASLASYEMLIKVKPQFDLVREAVIEILNEYNGKYAIYQFQSLQKNRDNRLIAQSTTASLTVVVFAISFILATIGIYGVQNYSSQMRKVEYGVRMSVGANSWDLIKLSLKETYLLFASGVLSSGVLLSTAYLLDQSLKINHLFTHGAGMIGATIGALGLILVVACYIPVSRFSRKPVIYSLRG